MYIYQMDVVSVLHLPVNDMEDELVVVCETWFVRGGDVDTRCNYMH